MDNNSTQQKILEEIEKMEEEETEALLKIIKYIPDKYNDKRII